jgi:hypothetical protein
MKSGLPSRVGGGLLKFELNSAFSAHGSRVIGANMRCRLLSPATRSGALFHRKIYPRAQPKNQTATSNPSMQNRGNVLVSTLKACGHTGF